jgi:hypothetical protein
MQAAVAKPPPTMPSKASCRGPPWALSVFGVSQQRRLLGPEGRGNPVAEEKLKGMGERCLSKSKKRDRKLREHQKREKAEFMEWAKDAADDADEFLETATPFEISRSLAEIGVSTTHRSGIEEILSNIVNELHNQDAPPEAIVREMLTGLVSHWKSELKSKDKSVDLEDLVFLLQTAQHYALKWVSTRIRLDQADIPETPGLRKSSLTDFYPFKKSGES